MRMTFIIPSLNIGGAELQTVIQINELITRGVDIQIIILSNKSNLTGNLSSKINSLFQNNSSSLENLNKKSFIGALFSLKRLSNAINDFCPDQIVAILPVSFLTIRLLRFFNLIKKSTGIWLYHQATEYIENPINSLAKKIYHYVFVRFLSSNQENHIFISKAVRQNIERHEKIIYGFILYNAIQQPVLNIKERTLLLEKFDLQNKKYFIIPGRLDPVKGHLFFLSSCKDLIIKYDLKILIAGYGKMEDTIKLFIKEQGLSKNIFMTGKLRNSHLLELNAASYLCIIPSLVEGLGIVAIECLSVGTTVLCSNAGGLPEVIKDGETGYVFQKENTKDLREKLEKLILNKELLINPDVLKKEYQARFTVKAQIDNLIKILDEKG